MPTPVPSAHVVETPVEVRSYELDSFGHVNHAVFLNYLEYARFDALRVGGFPHEELMRRGWGVYVVRIEVDYLREAHPGQRLLVRTWAERYKRSSAVLAQEIVREDDPQTAVVRARVTAVWVGPNGKPMRVPEEVHLALPGPFATTSGDP
ncbi:MAG: thioesterase family protein [Gemmatimonadota bacterium]|jgi:acyl-CoA thioester hydrolase